MKKRCGRLGLCSFFLLASFASIAGARVGVVKTNDGQTYSGDVNENGPDADSIGVTVHGGTLSIPRSNVLRIDYDDQFDASFGKKLAALEPSDLAGRMDLAREALAAGKFDLAAQATQSVLEFAPHNSAAQEMLAAIQAQKISSPKCSSRTRRARWRRSRLLCREPLRRLGGSKHRNATGNSRHRKRRAGDQSAGNHRSRWRRGQGVADDGRCLRDPPG